MNELLHVLTDPAHITAEIIMELASYLIFGGLAIKLWHRWHKRHDARVHMVELDVLASLEDLTNRLDLVEQWIFAPLKVNTDGTWEAIRPRREP